MMPWLVFATGALLGYIAGLFTISLCVLARKGDNRAHRTTTFQVVSRRP